MATKTRAKRRAPSTVQQMTPEEMAALCPEVFGSVNFGTPEPPKPSLPRPVLRTIKGPNGKLVEAPIAWEGDSIQGFAKRNSMTVTEAMHLMEQARAHPGNAPEVIDGIMAATFREAVQ